MQGEYMKDDRNFSVFVTNQNTKYFCLKIK